MKLGHTGKWPIFELDLEIKTNILSKIHYDNLKKCDL